MKGKGGNEGEELTMDNVYGVFLLLSMGCGVGIVIGCMEWIWLTGKNARKDKVFQLSVLPQKL